MQENQSNILIYQTADGITKIETRLLDDTVWLTQAQMSDLFQKNRVTITEHLSNIFKDGELDESSVCRKFRRTASDGKNYEKSYYNLDVIISVGYRVKSNQGTQFRIWATQRLKEYIVKGFSYKMIASEMLISIETVRSHIKKIYKKLQVNSATEAVYKYTQSK